MWCNKHPCILLSSRRVVGYGDYEGNRPDTKEAWMLLNHYLALRSSKTLQKIMITTDIHANRLYITHLYLICWYTAIHVEYLLYHLSLISEIASFKAERQYVIYSNKVIKSLPAYYISLMCRKCMTKIYVFWE